MKKIIFSILLGLGMINTAIAGDAEAGKTKSMMCSACHGTAGFSAVPMYPNLAGQKETYIAKQLNDFKSGFRNDATMKGMVAALTDADIANLATYYASLPRTIEVANTTNENTKAETTTVVTPAASVTVAIAETTTHAPVKGNNSVQAGKEKSAMCSSCHGADGNSLVPLYPSLAGQGASYIAKQLADFKTGARVDPIMAGMVAALSNEDMANLGAYFTAQTAKESTAETSNIGKKLYFGGNASKGLTACIACHSVNGKGMKKAAFPAIAGQSADYLKKQLIAFRSGTRSNDNNEMMRNIAIKLSDTEINELAQYMSSIK